MIGNVWGVSKYVAIKYIKLIIVIHCNRISDKICISFSNEDGIHYCLHLNFNTLISCIATCSETIYYLSLHCTTRQKQKYRGMFENQKSRNKTSSGDIGLNIRTLASPKVGQDQVSGGVSVPCWHATPVADALWKPIFGKMSDSVMMSSQGIMSQTGLMSKRCKMSLVSTSRTNASPKRDRTRCPEE